MEAAKSINTQVIKPKKKFQWEKITPYLFISPWIIGFLVFTVGPLIFSLIISFFEWPIIGEAKFVGFKNYVTMFTKDPQVWKSLWITIKYSIIFVPINLFIALFLAILLNQKVKGSSWFKTIFYLPTVISGVAFAMIWGWIYDNEYGIFNYALSLIGIKGPNWLGDPKWALFAMILACFWGQGGMMLIFLAGLKDIPKELYESASIDGAGAIAKFFKITLPMLSPTILFNLIMTIIGTFQSFGLALLLTGGGPMRSTYFYGLMTYNNAFKDFKMGYASANAWFMFIIILGMTMLVFKSSSAWVYYEGASIKGKKNKKKNKKKILQEG